jgi:PTS system sucrose-specific IIC component
MSTNRSIAEEILVAVGGQENVESVAHCATRLRFMVKDVDQVDQAKVENVEKVKGAFYNAGQFQVILGTGTVNRIYEEILQLGLNDSSSADMKHAAVQKSSRFQQAIRTFGDVFVPIIPVLVATGLFMGLRGLVLQEEVLAWFGVTPDSVPQNFLLFTQVLTDTAFIFLPALIAWSTFRVFGGTPIIGMVLGLMLVSPSLPNAYAVASGDAEAIMLFDWIPVVGYQGSVLPAFIAGILGAKLERRIRNRVPETLDLIITPFMTLLIMIVVSLLVVGPIFHSVEQVILDAATTVLSWPFGISGLIIGGLNQLIVITGVHHVFNMLEIQLLAEYKYNPYNAIVTCSVAAQGGAALAVGLKTKSKKLKALALPSSFSAFLGITEPAIFGVNLRYGKPFVMGFLSFSIRIKSNGDGCYSDSGDTSLLEWASIALSSRQYRRYCGCLCIDVDVWLFRSNEERA